MNSTSSDSSLKKPWFTAAKTPASQMPGTVSRANLTCVISCAATLERANANVAANDAIIPAVLQVKPVRVKLVIAIPLDEPITTADPCFARVGSGAEIVLIHGLATVPSESIFGVWLRESP